MFLGLLQDFLNFALIEHFRLLGQRVWIRFEYVWEEALRDVGFGSLTKHLARN